MKSVFILMTLMSSFFVQATDQLVLSSHSHSVLTRVLDNGVSQIESLDVNVLSRLTSNIQYRTMEEGDRDSWANRESAYYRENVVYSSENFGDEINAALSLLSLHEELGAVGLEDNEYEKSIILKLLSELPENERAILLETEMVKRQFSSEDSLYSSSEGGTTVIGGGGELSSAWIKYKIIKELIKSNLRGNDRITLEAINYMINIPFEPSDDHDGIVIGFREVDNGIDVKFDLINKEDKSFYTLLHPTVYVPRNLSTVNGKEVEAILYQVADYIRILARKDGVSSLDITPYERIYTCQKKSLVLHPKILRMLDRDQHYYIDRLKPMFKKRICK